jgi:hypothetical protein
MDSEYRPVFDRPHRLIVAMCPHAEAVLSYRTPTCRVGRGQETVKLRPADAAGIPDAQFHDLIRAALRA